MNFRKYQTYWVSVAILLAIFILWYFRIIFLYIFFAMCLTFILTPLVNALSKGKHLKFKIPRVYATLIAFMVFVGLIVIFFSTVFPLVVVEIDHLRAINPTELASIFDYQIQRVETLLINNKLSQQPPGFLKQLLATEIGNIFNSQMAGSMLSNLFSGISNLIIAIFSISFISFFSLKDENLLKKSVANIIPGRYYVDYITVFNSIENLLSRYFIGLLIQASAISILVTIGLYLLGVQNAILIGILVGIANVIPYLGQVLAVFIALLLGIASNMEMLQSTDLLFFLLKITGVVVATQTLDSFVMQPLIFSRSVKAHPLEIFLMVFVGGTIAGPFGMFLAIPLYTIVKVTYIGFYKILKQKLIIKNT
jgi:predicted PurR-regulated permease PerM